MMISSHRASKESESILSVEGERASMSLNVSMNIWLVRPYFTNL